MVSLLLQSQLDSKYIIIPLRRKQRTGEKCRLLEIAVRPCILKQNSSDSNVGCIDLHDELFPMVGLSEHWGRNEQRL